MSNVCRKLFAIYYFFEIFIFHRHFQPAAVPQGFKIYYFFRILPFHSHFQPAAVSQGFHVYDFIKISHYPIFQIIFELPRQKSRTTVLPNLHPLAPWPQIFLFIDVSMKQFDTASTKAQRFHVSTHSSGHEASIQLLQLVDPDRYHGVARHAEVAARGDRDRADLRAVREAAALELL